MDDYVGWFCCCSGSGYTWPWSLTSLNRDKKELSPSDEAPPKIHNNIELNGLSEVWLGVASVCCAVDSGKWSGLPILSALLVSDVSWSPGTSAALFNNGTWSCTRHLSVPDGAMLLLLTELGFLVFNLVMWSVDARIVEEVMRMSAGCWNWDRRVWMNLWRAGTCGA